MKMWHMRYSRWAIFFGILMMMSCDLINPAEPVPATIHLNPFTFDIEPGQGSANNRISEVWVYANGNYLGTFSPPVDIRYLEEGLTSFTFRPGIRNNGIAGDAITYPLFTGYTIDFDIVPGTTYQVTPLTRYQPDAVFSLIADFELSNPFTDNKDTVAASQVLRSMTDVFEGQYAGEIIMSEQADYIDVGQALGMSDLPVDGTAAYLEFRYKCETEFSIGILGTNLEGQSYSNYFYLVKPTTEWNMLYIELTDLLEASALSSYKIFFRSLYPPSATKPELPIFLDNIKVVHLIP